MIDPRRAVSAVRELWPRFDEAARGLPPGQGLVDGFPRFGVHFADPAPAVPARPSLEVRGAVAEPFDLPLADLEGMPRRTLVADFHCVAGWSARGLRWEGVPFRTLWEESILPRGRPPAEVTHLVFAGLDGYRSAVSLEDALGEDTLLADGLDGAPLDADHGAPARFVSPGQYGYKNAKHLRRIELHTREPGGPWHRPGQRAFGLALLAPHPRARVAHEERHALLPAWAVRHFYRRALLPILAPRMGPGRRTYPPA